MSEYNKEYVRERMRELEKEARAYELARRCMAMKKKKRKSFWVILMNYFHR
ncbi:hypothetical protein [Sporosarcina limicola]|uniref:Uncharacterized protein n=1 Tax=Sporosarcina limicola TaxID=34101 RepID=A0A927RED8_9BACL|nr:hypothetical protein [Sporosarcina limicola]MBE1556230.1 hypothetical protein [Sporosarcina limicola]